MIYVQIKDLEQLKSAAADPLECFITLSGSLHSWKQINYDAVRDLWDVYNEIDDSNQEDLSFGLEARHAHCRGARKWRALGHCVESARLVADYRDERGLYALA